MESWKTVFRKGVAPLLPTEGLTALLEGLRKDDPRIIQGATCNPPPLRCVQEWPVEQGDAIVYAFWQGCDPLNCTVGQAEEYFARTCYDCDQLMREPAACRWFLNWHDDTPRNQMRKELAAEVSSELARRLADMDGLSPFEPGTPAGIIGDFVEEQYGAEKAKPYRQMEALP